MKKITLLLGALGIVFGAVTVADSVNAAGPTLAGPKGKAPVSLPITRATQLLFRGDMTAEIGIGCSNSAGTSGGPNDVAVGVTASTVVTPFDIVQTTYNLFTQVSPNITSMSFSAWSSVSGSGTLIGTVPGAPFSQGNHTFTVNPPISVNQLAFFFGFQQTQTNVGLRWGVDTNGGSAGTSYIRAPTCGATNFVTLDSVGFPGNWVFRALVDDNIPVELFEFSVE